MGLRSLLPTSLATIGMAKGQPPTLYCTQGALPYRTCLCCMGTPVVRVLCPLPLRQRGSSVPSQSAPRSGPDCIPPVAILFMALFDCRIRAIHIAGSSNCGADELSRNRLTPFLNSHPTALPFPTQIPQELMYLLLCAHENGTSPRWRQLFSNFCKMV